MAAPNIVGVTNILGKTNTVPLLYTTANTIVSNPVSSGSVYKINSLLVTNSNTSVSCDITSTFVRTGANTKLASTITIPTKSTLVVLSKDIGIYLEEGDSITVLASSNNCLEAVCSYEVIS